MQFIHSNNGVDGVQAMAHTIIEKLKVGKVLWLLCGGSNIPLAKAAMDIIRTNTFARELQNLSVGLTDERYGQVGHKDSNWEQLLEVGFNFNDIQTLPILFGKSLDETVTEYAQKLGEAFDTHPYVVAQFGIGADGHIAGMLPHTGGLESGELVFGYDAAQFVRISITPPAFKKIHTAFAFVFGETKRDAVQKLHEELSILDEPCQLLKHIPECSFYSDLV